VARQALTGARVPIGLSLVDGWPRSPRLFGTVRFPREVLVEVVGCGCAGEETSCRPGAKAGCACPARLRPCPRPRLPRGRIWAKARSRISLQALVVDGHDAVSEMVRQRPPAPANGWACHQWLRRHACPLPPGGFPAQARL